MLNPFVNEAFDLIQADFFESEPHSANCFDHLHSTFCSYISLFLVIIIHLLVAIFLDYSLFLRDFFFVYSLLFLLLLFTQRFALHIELFIF